jgi:serine/threonine protein kinase
MNLQLHVIAGPDKGRNFPLHAGPDLMIGRSAHAYYEVHDPQVARNHCQVLREGDQVTVIDNGAEGGTLVNGQRVERHVLQTGDVVQVGQTQLRLEVAEERRREEAKKPAPEPEPAAATADTEPPVESLSGKHLAHFDVGEVIGKGVTGVVFRATDTKGNHDVALKVLHPEYGKCDKAVQHFVQVMKAVLPLRHPHLITVHAAGKSGSYCWISMDHVEGKNLAQLIERVRAEGKPDWRTGFKVMVQVAKALAYAHGHNVVHGHLTPTNVIREASTKAARLGDLLLAKAIEGDVPHPWDRPDAPPGDTAYMSPERTEGLAKVDARSDLYSLGATIHALLTGRPPFAAKTREQTVARVRAASPEKPTKHQPEVPPPFEAVVLKLMEKKPERRFQTAGELLAELDEIGRAIGMTV